MTTLKEQFSLKNVKALSLSNVWFELVDPTENELLAVSDVTQLPVNFLRLPKTDGYIDLRLEDGYGIINFLVMQDVVSTKTVYPVVMAFSKRLSCNGGEKGNPANR